MSNKVTETSDLHQKLRQYRGSINEVATKAGCSTEWVRNVLRGKYVDSNVVKVAASVLKKRYEDEQKIMAEMSDLINACDVTKIRSALQPVEA